MGRIHHFLAAGIFWVLAGSLCSGFGQVERVVVSDPETLVGSNWALVSLAGEQVPGEKPTLQFLEEGRVAGFAGVNRFMGPVEARDVGIGFGPLASTMMAGPPEAMALEQSYLGAMGKVRQVRREGEELVLASDDEVELLRFAAEPGAE